METSVEESASGAEPAPGGEGEEGPAEGVEDERIEEEQGEEAPEPEDVPDARQRARMEADAGMQDLLAELEKQRVKLASEATQNAEVYKTLRPAAEARAAKLAQAAGVGGPDGSSGEEVVVDDAEKVEGAAEPEEPIGREAAMDAAIAAAPELAEWSAPPSDPFGTGVPVGRGAPRTSRSLTNAPLRGSQQLRRGGGAALGLSLQRYGEHQRHWAEVSGKGTPLEQRVKRTHRNVTDLLNRSEYLASLISAEADPRDVDPRTVDLDRIPMGPRLEVSAVPELLDATVHHLQSRIAETAVDVQQVREDLKYLRQRERPFDERDSGHMALPGKHMSAKSVLESLSDRQRALVGVDDVADNIAFLNPRSGTQLSAEVMQCLVDGVAADDADALQRLPQDHMELQRRVEARYCGKGVTVCRVAPETVVGAGEAGTLVSIEESQRLAAHAVSKQDMAYAKLFWSRSRQGKNDITGQRFTRIDDNEIFSGTYKFSLTENEQIALRQEKTSIGKLLKNCNSSFHMVLSCTLPAKMFPVGHYFEICVKTLFTDDREVGRPRFEGLVLGVTCKEPGSLNKETRTVTDTPLSWCVSMNGTFYANRSEEDLVAAHHMLRTVSPANEDEEGFRLQFTRPWHRVKKTKAPDLVQWPPPEDPPEKTRRQLPGWSQPLREGDILGLLVTTSGGLVVMANRTAVMCIPDADVAFDRPLYPLIEAYNRVRSVQLRPGATPPER